MDCSYGGNGDCRFKEVFGSEPQPEDCLGCIGFQFYECLMHIRGHLGEVELKLKDLACFIGTLEETRRVISRFRAWLDKHHKGAYKIELPKVDLKAFFKEKHDYRI